MVVSAEGETGSVERCVMGLSVLCLGALVALAGEAEEEVRLGVVAPMMTTTTVLSLLSAVA